MYRSKLHLLTLTLIADAFTIVTPAIRPGVGQWRDADRGERTVGADCRRHEQSVDKNECEKSGDAAWNW